MNYKEAGVNIEEGYRAVQKYKSLAAETASKAVLGGLGSFAGLYSLKEFLTTMEEPVLVSGTDSVGTKLEIAFKLKKYDTVGIDCVAMCVNDILCQGAKPLFFLDYIACGKLYADIAAELVKGVAAGCKESGTALLGGETAEHPGVMPDDLYDLSGFTVGIVDRKKIIDGSKVREGDLLIGLASSGVHSNGFSLIRKVIPDLNEDFGGRPIGQVLLEPTRLYVKPVLALMEKIDIHGMAHITGGGFYENIPRVFPSGSNLSAVIKAGSWEIPPVFNRIAEGIKTASGSRDINKTLFNTFNMGIGFILAITPGDAANCIALLAEHGFPAREIGFVEKVAPKGGGSEGLRFA
ncbi:MAG: phosphoribosylformylglycinamidine cyclo-ligase [Treponema sp.]|nr:phosphoribosylformylglycinamidine cyclo-ligase [Treponema sp.]